MSEAILRCENVVKRFRRQTVLDGTDLDVQPGEVTVLLGPNGVGKSTLLRCAMGLVRPDGGSIRIAGIDPARNPGHAREKIGYVPDVPDVSAWMTLRDVYRICAAWYPSWDAAEASRLADVLAIPDRTPIATQSRGQGMKAMLAAALAIRPPLLLLDEPFAGLDPIAREDVLRGIIGELRDADRAVLCTTHDLDVASRIADRVAIMADGRIARHGTFEDVIERAPESARDVSRLRDAYVDAVDPQEVLS
ncbi:MAG: hypothetical protein CMJ83_01785 [Planctomycetes bacterium]|jgi:ABC-2 type transport system ATP-binding protein|nr:hypothetical protein [Planctomycetota bacterium]